MQYVLNQPLVLTWKFDQAEVVHVASDFDITVRLPSGVKYSDNAASSVVLSDDGTSGTITYNFTPTESGLSTITLAVQEASTHIRKKKIDIWVIKDSANYTSRTRQVVLPAMGPMEITPPNNIQLYPQFFSHHRSILWTGTYWIAGGFTAGSTIGKLFRSTNRADWVEVFSLSFGTFREICCSPDGQNIVATATPKRIAYSQDGGLTWTEDKTSFSGAFDLGDCVWSAEWNMFIVATNASGFSYYSSDLSGPWTAFPSGSPSNIIHLPNSDKLAHFRTSNRRFLSEPTPLLFANTLLPNYGARLLFEGKSAAGKTVPPAGFEGYYYVNSTGTWYENYDVNLPTYSEGYDFAIYEFWVEGLWRAFPMRVANNDTRVYKTDNLQNDWIEDTEWTNRLNGREVFGGGVSKETGQALIVMNDFNIWIA